MNDIRSYIARQDETRFVTSVVRGSLAQTLVAKLVARIAVVALGTALFIGVSPVAGFATVAVGLFLL